MTTITFYQQARADGGARTGIDVAVHGRVHGREISKQLKRIAKDWTKLLRYEVRTLDKNFPK